MPIRRRRPKTSLTRRTSSPSTRTLPETVAPGMKSMVRLRQRSSEVLPDCAGPMTPKISLRSTVEGDAVEHLRGAVGEAQVLDLDDRLRSRPSRHHFFRRRSQTRTAIAVALTSSTEPSSTTAVA